MASKEIHRTLTHKMKTNFKLILLGAFVAVATSCQTQSPKQLELFPLFGDNMVLQQETEIPVWGTAPAKSTVEVLFRGTTVNTQADENGKWMVRLEAQKKGWNDSLVVSCKQQRIALHRVDVGVVWLASGQSNMEMPMSSNWAQVNNFEEEIANAQYPHIRLFTVNKNTAVSACDTISTDGWKPCSPETVKDFSAVAYFFGREIWNSQKIAVGLIQSAWGGTPAEAWTSAETLKLMEDFVGAVEKVESLPDSEKEQQKIYEKDNKLMHEEMAAADPGIQGKDTVFAAVEFDDSAWMPIDLPALWENSGLGVFDGSVWFRKEIELSEKCVGKDLMLNVSSSDDLDEAWFNGKKIGESGMWGAPRHYKVPKSLVKAGKNSITLRVTDSQGAGGFNGKKTDFSIVADGGLSLDISEGWKCCKGYNLKDIQTKPMKPGTPNRPSVLFNAMIKPLIPFAINGIIWYQGEDNTGRAYQYRELFSSLITDWRSQWEKDNLPFYFVQLAAHMKRNTEPVDDMWAELREAQFMALQLPNTGMAVAIDLGDAENIHPSNKQDVGRRLAYWALSKNFAEDIQYSGPLYQRYIVKGNKIEVEFSHPYDGMKSSDGKELKGFAIAGADQKFVWANAKIVGSNKIEVWSNSIAEPVAVRYAWSANPECNLVNSANLPATPFRTDNFKMITE